MRIVEIVDDFYFRMKWFVKDDCRTYLMWAGVICIARVMIPYLELKEFLERRCKMIIRVDSDSEKFQKLIKDGIGSEADVIFESHLVDDSSDNFIHPIKSIGGKKVLGWGKISSFFPETISSCEEKYIRAVGQPDRTHLKRIFQTLTNRQVEKITVAKLKLAEIEKYWCPHCESWDLALLPKDILSEKIAFLCRDCNEECYLDSREDAGYYYVKIKGALDGLEGRYKRRGEQRAERRKLLLGQEVVMVF